MTVDGRFFHAYRELDPALLYKLPIIVPFHSFPLDIMHLGMNIAKDMVEILKGEKRHLLGCEGYANEDFVVGADGWDIADLEIAALGSGTPHCTFGSRPRETSQYKSWKAAEYKQFIMS